MEHGYKSASSSEYLNAANDLVEITRYYPWRSELNIDAARYALHGGDAKTAIQFFDRPGMTAYLSADDLILLGSAYKQSGDTAKAEEILKEAAEQGEPTQAYQRLADLAMGEDDFESAITWQQKLLTINPSDSKLYYQIGLLYAATEPVKALPFLAQSAEIDPTTATEAKDLYDKIRTANLYSQADYILLTSGRQLANMGEWKYASEAFKRATEINPLYADAWAFLGEARQQVSSHETGAITNEGRSELEHALQLSADSVLGNTFMGLYWERQQDYPKAQQYLEHAIEMNPGNPYLYSELGNIISKAGDLPAAQAAYEAAIQLTPQDPTFYRQLAGFAMENQIQIRELALPAARQALLLDPHGAETLDVMAQVMLMLQDYHSAEHYALEALQNNPDLAQAYLHLGTAYLYLGETDLAYQWLDRARNVEPASWVTAQATRMIDYYFPK